MRLRRKIKVKLIKCRACRGSGKSSTEEECFPCGGTGKGIPVDGYFVVKGKIYQVTSTLLGPGDKASVECKRADSFKHYRFKRSEIEGRYEASV